MEIWIKQGSNKLRFPVLPEEYTVTSVQGNVTVNINALGEINLLGKRGLKGVGFSSLFPAAYQSYCEFTSIKKPQKYIELLEKMKRKGFMKLYITSVISMNVTIESLEYGENDSSGDIFFSVDFKEYRTLNIPVSSLATSEPAEAAVETAQRTVQVEAVKSYTVVKGDTLTGIARKTMGTTNWNSLYEANKSTIGGNPNYIQIGMVLTIPGG